MRTRPDVLILGGGYAGLLAAGRLASRAPEARITLVDAADRFRQRIRLHERLAGGEPRELDYARLLERRGVRFVRGWAEEVDLRAHCVTLRPPSGRLRTLGYDRLVLAAGSQTAATVPGAETHALRADHERGIDAIRLRLPELAGRGGRVVVAGTGLTGIEIAAELATRLPGLRLTLVGAEPFDADWSPAAAAHFRQFFARHRIELLEESRIEAVERGGVVLASGETLEADLTVWAGGFQASALAWNAGLTVQADGRVVVDATLRPAGHPDLLVAGDAAAARLGDGMIRMSCAAALPMGAHAGTNVARLIRGEEPEPFRFGFFTRCVSLGRRDGVVQFTDVDDHPGRRVLTGRMAAFVKEQICRMTVTVVEWETRRGIHAYRWPMPVRSEPAADLPLQLAS